MSQVKITDLTLRSNVTDGVNIPGDDGIQTYRVTASQLWDYIYGKMFSSSFELKNISIATSVASSALTVAIKTKAGSNASSTDKIQVGFRSATITSGVFVTREITSALSLVISSGSTLGQVNANPSRIWVYLIDNAGTPELAVSSAWYPEDALVSTTAEGGAGAADSRTTIYSASARTNVAIRLIGYIGNTQTTAGTWASAGSQIQLLPALTGKTKTVVTMTSSTGTYLTPSGCTRIRGRLIGGGGAGAGGGFSNGGSGGAGGDTTFSTFTAGGGSGGTATGGGPGGGGAVTFSGTGFGRAGSAGSGAGANPGGSVNVNHAGGGGGVGPWGGGGGGAAPGASSGSAGVANSGSGGGGGGVGTSGASATYAGSGGGSGAYIEFEIFNPAGSYSWGIGAAGTAGTAGSGGGAGGAGGSGFIIIEEFYS